MRYYNQCFYPLPIILCIMAYISGQYLFPICLFNRWLSLLMMRQNVLFSILRTVTSCWKVKDNTFLNLIMEYLEDIVAFGKYRGKD